MKDHMPDEIGVWKAKSSYWQKWSGLGERYIRAFTITAKLEAAEKMAAVLQEYADSRNWHVAGKFNVMNAHFCGISLARDALEAYRATSKGEDGG